jgi:HAD superfamily hydrolase (TIGR01484 family)
MNKILLCCDLDRTVLPNGHQPESPGARELFADLIHRGNILLAYVSGRDKTLLLEAIDQYNIPVPDYAIGDVGTTMYRIKNGDWSEMDSWAKHIGEDWHNIAPSEIHTYLADINALTLQETSKQGKHKLSYYVPVDIDTTGLLSAIKSRLDEHAIHANLIWSIDEIKNVGLLDILPARANKLHAIEFLISQTGSSKSHTVFAGDSGNDLPVIVSDVPSVLVKNASADVQDKAWHAIEKNGHKRFIYIARGDFHGLNGNYSAGIIEGLIHYHPQIEKLLTKVKPD